MTQWCANTTAVPPRPECQEQCDHCRRTYGPPEAFKPGLYHMELASGNFIDLANPDPAAITFDDVAWGLGNLCRYTGQSSIFYSVAEHAVLVAMRLESLGASPTVCLTGLHHDDAEALTGDISRPLKRLLGDAFVPIEEVCHWAATTALGVADLPYHDPMVKEADDWALMQEAYQLMPSQGANWYPADRYPPQWPPFWTLGMSSSNATATDLWVQTHARLSEALASE